jgi:UDP-glucose 4-epimerase
MATEVDCPPGIAMNCAVHQRIDLNQLVIEINKILRKDIKPEYTEPRPGDVKHSFADISLIKNTLGFEPKIYFEEGLKKTINWYKTQG